MSSALSGGSLSCSSSPLSESALICSSFSPRRFGQLGLLGGAAPIVFQLLIRGMSLLVLARIGVRVTLPGRRRICGSIVFGQNALMPMVQGLEGRPLWGRAVYTALHGARLSSVPSGDQSANPASVPGRSVL